MAKAGSRRGKRSSGVNKSQAVRDYMAANPSAMPKDVSAALAEQGIQVTPQLVSTIKFNAAKKSKKRGPKAGGRKVGAVKASASRGTSVSLASLHAAKEFASQNGGIETARQLLEALSSLQ